MQLATVILGKDCVVEFRLWCCILYLRHADFSIVNVRNLLFYFLLVKTASAYCMFFSAVNMRLKLWHAKFIAGTVSLRYSKAHAVINFFIVACFCCDASLLSIFMFY